MAGVYTGVAKTATTSAWRPKTANQKKERSVLPTHHHWLSPPFFFSVRVKAPLKTCLQLGNSPRLHHTLDPLTHASCNERANGGEAK